MAIKPRVEVIGVREIVGKLTPKLYEPAGKAALVEFATTAAQAARAGAPRRTGKLAASITPKVNSIPAPRWAVVKVAAVNHRGFSYPKLLEFNAKWGHKNWLLKAIRSVGGTLAGVTEKAARKVVAEWGK